MSGSATELTLSLTREFSGESLGGPLGGPLGGSFGEAFVESSRAYAGNSSALFLSPERSLSSSAPLSSTSLEDERTPLDSPVLSHDPDMSLRLSHSSDSIQEKIGLLGDSLISHIANELYFAITDDNREQWSSNISKIDIRDKRNPFNLSYDNETLLFHAVKNNRLFFVQEILKIAPHLIQNVNEKKQNVLMLAVAYGYHDIVVELIKAGSHKTILFQKTISGLNILGIAVKNNRMICLKSLLQSLHSEDSKQLLEDRDDEGASLLHVASSVSVEMVDFIITVAPQLLSARDREHINVAFYSIFFYNLEIVKYYGQHYPELIFDTLPNRMDAVLYALSYPRESSPENRSALVSWLLGFQREAASIEHNPSLTTCLYEFELRRIAYYKNNPISKIPGFEPFNLGAVSNSSSISRSSSSSSLLPSSLNSSSSSSSSSSSCSSVSNFSNTVASNLLSVSDILAALQKEKITTAELRVELEQTKNLSLHYQGSLLKQTDFARQHKEELETQRSKTLGLKKKLKIKDDEISKYLKAAKTLEDTLNFVSNQLKNKLKELDLFSNLIFKTEDDYQQLQNSLEKTNTELADLKSQYRNEKQRLEKGLKIIQQKNTTIEHLTADLQFKESEITGIKETLGQRDKQLDSLTIKIQTLEATLHETRQTIEKQQLIEGNLKKEIEFLKKEHADYSQKMESFLKHVTSQIHYTSTPLPMSPPSMQMIPQSGSLSQTQQASPLPGQTFPHPGQMTLQYMVPVCFPEQGMNTGTPFFFPMQMPYPAMHPLPIGNAQQIPVGPQSGFPQGMQGVPQNMMTAPPQTYPQNTHPLVFTPFLKASVSASPSRSSNASGSSGASISSSSSSSSSFSGSPSSSPSFSSSSGPGCSRSSNTQQPFIDPVQALSFLASHRRSIEGSPKSPEFSTAEHEETSNLKSNPSNSSRPKRMLEHTKYNAIVDFENQNSSEETDSKRRKKAKKN